MVFSRTLSAEQMDDGMGGICVQGDTLNDVRGLGMTSSTTIYAGHRTCASRGYTQELTVAGTAGETNTHGYKTVHQLLVERPNTEVWN